MIRYLTAGESHGKGLMLIAEGFPANIPIDINAVNHELQRRQGGYGRGGRMKIEKDTAEIISGIRFGKTIGSPIGILIRNRDWENWQGIMDAGPVSVPPEKITVPRPGHADVTGTQKYGFDDIRNSIERSSARETAARVAAGALAKQLLARFGIRVSGFVESVGGIYSARDFYGELLENWFTTSEIHSLCARAEASDVRVPDDEQEAKIIRRVKKAKKEGDTLGGTFITAVTGIPPGIGSYMHYDRKLDAALSHAVASIHAVKAVEIGMGFAAATRPGSAVHDEITLNRKKEITRATNRAGGIEGGISTGLPILLRGAMKPIATLMMPLGSVDFASWKQVQARRERSDFVAVPACSVIAEAVTAWVTAQYFLQKFGGDSLAEVTANHKNYTEQLHTGVRNTFKKGAKG